MLILTEGGLDAAGYHMQPDLPGGPGQGEELVAVGAGQLGKPLVAQLRPYHYGVYAALACLLKDPVNRVQFPGAIDPVPVRQQRVGGPPIPDNGKDGSFPA